MVVLQGTGQIVHLKGQVALDASGAIIGAGDMRAQVRQVLTNIKTVLATIGGRMSDVISLTQYMTDIQAFLQTGDIRKEFFTAPYPVTTTVEVAALYNPEIVIEITAIAEIPSSDTCARPRLRPCTNSHGGSLFVLAATPVRGCLGALWTGNACACCQ